ISRSKSTATRRECASASRSSRTTRVRSSASSACARRSMAEANQLDEVDRTIARASRELAAAVRRLEHGKVDEPNPLSEMRHVSSRAAFVDLCALGDDPIARALRAHVARLTIERVTWEDRVRLAVALAEPSVVIA